MQMITPPSSENADRLHIYINSSPVQACIIHDLLKTNLEARVLIQCRGMTTKFSEVDKEYSCHDESMINSRKIVFDLITNLKAVQSNIKYWTIYASHGDSLLARIVCAAGGRIYYIDDGLGTYAALADYLNNGKSFKKLLLHDKQFKIPLLDINLNYLGKRHWIEGLFRCLIFIIKINLPASILFAAFSRNLYKQYFRFEPKLKWQMKLLYNPFLRLKNIENTEVPLASITSKRDRALVLLPPYLQTEPTHFLSFLEAASKICATKNYKYVYIKIHPADTKTVFSMDFNDFFPDRLVRASINTPTEVSIWAYNHNFRQVIVFNTSSTFYARKIIKSDYFTWTDLYQTITGTKSATDIVYEALIEAGCP